VVNKVNSIVLGKTSLGSDLVDGNVLLDLALSLVNEEKGLSLDVLSVLLQKDILLSVFLKLQSEL
jgi:hypothetical protein